MRCGHIVKLSIIGFLAMGIGAAMAKDDPPPAGCGSWSQISTSFIESCALAGATTYIICTANGDVMCCKDKASGGRDCSTNPGDLLRRTPGGVNPKNPANPLPKKPSTRPMPPGTAPPTTGK